MEARKITVVSTTTQSKHVIMSSATTLAELKNDLREHSIDYYGLTFFEGLTKTELKDDSSVLPHDVPYKGKTTNELVFMLTVPNKKIRSGADMNRSEIYTKIKEMNLQSECVERFGKNYTMCKTADLISLIEDNIPVAPPTLPEENSTDEKRPSQSTDDSLRRAFNLLLDILEEGEMIDVDEIRAALSTPTSNNTKTDSPYSDDELNDMFNFVNN